MRRGLGQLVPMSAVQLFTGEELERLVCGERDWTVAELRKGADVRLSGGRDAFLWQALADFTREERNLFIRFAWGRSRLPVSGDFRFRCDETHVHGDPDAHLPTTSTCFFQLHLPRYTSAAALKEKLLYACYNCRDMDLC